MSFDLQTLSSLLDKYGLPLFFLLLLTVFVWRAGWPFLKERITQTDARMELMQKTLDESRVGYIESMGQRDKQFTNSLGELVASQSEASAKIIEALNRSADSSADRDSRIVEALHGLANSSSASDAKIVDALQQQGLTFAEGMAKIYESQERLARSLEIRNKRRRTV